MAQSFNSRIDDILPDYSPEFFDEMYDKLNSHKYVWAGSEVNTKFMLSFYSYNQQFISFMYLSKLGGGQLPHYLVYNIQMNRHVMNCLNKMLVYHSFHTVSYYSDLFCNLKFFIHLIALDVVLNLDYMVIGMEMYLHI